MVVLAAVLTVSPFATAASAHAMGTSVGIAASGCDELSYNAIVKSEQIHHLEAGDQTENSKEHKTCKFRCHAHTYATLQAHTVILTLPTNIALIIKRPRDQLAKILSRFMRLERPPQL